MLKFFTIEVSDKHLSRHDLMLALVEKFGSGKIVAVESASQQMRGADLAVCSHCGAPLAYDGSCLAMAGVQTPPNH